MTGYGFGRHIELANMCTCRYKLMKGEARSAEHSLQQKIGDLDKDLKQALAENGDLKSKVENIIRTLESKLKSVNSSIKNKELECANHLKEWEETSNRLKEREKEIEAIELQNKTLLSINDRLQNEVSSLNDLLEQLKRDQQVITRSL